MIIMLTCSVVTKDNSVKILVRSEIHYEQTLLLVFPSKE